MGGEVGNSGVDEGSVRAEVNAAEHEAEARAAEDRASDSEERAEADEKKAEDTNKSTKDLLHNDSGSSGSQVNSSTAGSFLIILIVLAAFHWGLGLLSPSPALEITLGFLLVGVGSILSLLTTTEGKTEVLIFPIPFITWYLFFRNLETIPIFLGIFLGLASLTLIVDFVRKHQGGAVGTITREANGFLLVFLFFASSGLIPYLIDQIGFVSIDLTGSLLGMILFYAPWWLFYGTFIGAQIPNLTGAAYKVWRVSLWFTVASGMVFFLMVPSIGIVSDSLDFLPSVQELKESELIARQSYEADLPLSKQLAFRMECATSSFSQLGTSYQPDDCYDEKVLEFEIEKYCEDVEEYTPGTQSFAQCTEERQEQLGGSAVQGVTDSSLKPVLVTISDTRKIVTPSGSSRGNQQVVRSVFADQLSYGFVVDIDNSPGKEFGIEVACSYANTKYRGEKVQGVIEYPFDSFTQPYYLDSSDDFSGQFLCTFPRNLDGQELTSDTFDDYLVDGSYTIEFVVTLVDFESFSRQERLWVERYESENDWQSIVASLKHGGKVYGSDEFARINFNLGGDSAVLQADQKVLLQSFIENVGEGEISAIHEYSVDVYDYYSVESGKDSCMFGGSDTVFLGDKNRESGVLVPQCFVTPSSTLLSLVDDGNDNSFKGEFRSTVEASLVFDYDLSHSIVTPVYQIIEDCEVDQTIDCGDEEEVVLS